MYYGCVAEPSSDVQAVIAAVHALDQAKTDWAIAQHGFEEAREKLQLSEKALKSAEAHLQQLVATKAPSPPLSTASRLRYRLPDDLPLCWRLGFLILESPKLDYAGWGKKLWEEDLAIDVVRNRLSTHLDRLKKLGVIVRDGDSYGVNAAKLAEHSGVTITREAVS